MKSQLLTLTYEIELQAGELLTLPTPLLESLGEGRWLITIQPVLEPANLSARDHRAFLNSYAPSDEGLYDDYTR